jgi:hypothetical protein
MGDYTPGSDNSIPGLVHDIVGCVFGKADDGALLLRNSGGGSGEEDKGEEESLSELHFGIMVFLCFEWQRRVVNVFGIWGEDMM